MGAPGIDRLEAEGLSQGLLSAAVAANSGTSRSPLLFGNGAWPGHPRAIGQGANEWADSALAYGSADHDPQIDSEDESRTLLISIADGDRTAFWALWQKYQRHLFAVCLKQMGGVRADAEDALSKAMLKALDTMPRHARVVINPRAWLTRLTCNVCIEMHRERSRRRARVSSEPGLVVDGRLTYSNVTPEDTLLHGEIYAFVAWTIDRLTTRLREPLILRFAHGLSCREVAERLMLSSENVRKRIQQARVILREELAKFSSGTLGAGDLTPSRFRGRRPPSEPAKRPAKDKKKFGRKNAVLCAGIIAQGSGAALDVRAMLDRRPAREHHRLTTLNKYVEKHPTGWKKRLELAHLLRTMGRWDESIEHYRYVLSRQPRLVEGWISLANLLRLSCREQEAIAAYGRALNLISAMSAAHQPSGLTIMSRC
jgi:RNA polymerase sigma-70 factor (ECF subfamily)